MEDLPDAILHNILCRLDIPSFCSAASSCRFLWLTTCQALPQLKKLHLTDLAPRMDNLELLLSRNTELKSLKLDCEHLEDSALDLIANPCLEEIELLNCDRFSAKLLSEIGNRCLHLRSLSLSFSLEDDVIHSVGLEDLLKSCPSLVSLVWKGQGCLDSYACSSIPKLASSNLKVLGLGYVLERNARQLFNSTIDHPPCMGQKSYGLQGLQKLSLFLDRITDTLMFLITQNIHGLTELELQDEPAEEPLMALDLSTTGIQYIGALTRLQKLVLIRSQYSYPATFKRVEDLGFLLLADRCTKLESITLGGFSRISDASCRQILHSFLKLHTFELLDSRRVTDLTFRDFSVIPIQLVSVTLSHCNLISDYSMSQLSYCRGLEVMNLKGCKSIGDKGLKAITGLEKLRTLNINGLDISDEGLAKLGKGKASLVCLSLRGCQKVTDAGIAALVAGSLSQTLECIDLSNITSLTDRAVLELIHSGMRIVDLRLRDCSNIGDTSVIALASMAFKGCGYGGTLRLLDLWNCKGITLLSARWFKKPYFPRLRWLGIGWNSFSKAVLDYLEQERPYIHILDHGNELGGFVDSEGNLEHYQAHFEEEDELERWLRAG